MRRAFTAHSSPDRANAATTPNRKECTAPTLPSPEGRGSGLFPPPLAGEGRVGVSASDRDTRLVLGLVCRRRRRRRAVRVVVVVPAAVAPGAASPRAPGEQLEEE